VTRRARTASHVDGPGPDEGTYLSTDAADHSTSKAGSRPLLDNGEA
jgi:hypothetical protein